MMTQPADIALLTDLYELTMAQTYFHEEHNDHATFSLFIRKYPPNRGFLSPAAWRTCCVTLKNSASRQGP